MIMSFQAATFATVFIQGFASGVLGCFLLLKKESLLIDALSHACFPGIALAYALLPTFSFFPPLLCGIITASIGYSLITYIYTHTPLKQDTALGVILSMFFGIGLVIITIVQKKPIEAQGHLRAYLFGNITTLLPSDLYLICAISIVAVAVLWLLMRPLISSICDPTYARVHALLQPWHQRLYHFIILLVVLSGLQTSGIILTSAMMIAPAIFARALSSHISFIIPIAGLSAGMALTSAYYVSSVVQHIPPGPTAILIASSFAFSALMYRKIRSKHAIHATREGI